MLSPMLAISFVTRPENGVTTTVLRSSLKAIWPIAGFWLRKKNGCAGTMLN